MKYLLPLVLFALPVWGQTPYQIQFVTINPSGSCSNPGYITVNRVTGDMYSCVNGAWATVGGGGGGGGSSVGGTGTLVGANLVLTALNTSNPLTGVVQVFGQCTFAPLAGTSTESAYIYTSAGNSGLTDGIHIKAATNTFTASGSGCVADSASVGANPAGTTLLYTWPMTLGAFGSVATADWRSQLTSASFVTGTGLQQSGGNTLAINSSTVQQFAPPKTVTAATYVVLDSDRNGLLVFTNAGSVSVTLPQAGAGGSFVSGWKVDMQCLGCGGVTVTPTTSTINGTTSLSVPASVWAQIRSDGTNYNGATTQGAVGPTGPTGPTAISGSLVSGNVVTGFDATTIQDSGLAVPTGGFAGLNQTNTFGSSAYNDEHSATTPHRLPVIAGCNPGTTNPGQVCYDSTQKSYVMNDAVLGQTYPIRSLVPQVSPDTPTSSWQCSTDAGSYNGGTSTQATAGSPCYFPGITIPANTLITSKGLECTVGLGYTSGTSPPVLTYVLAMDSTTIWFDNGQSSTTASVSNQGLYGEWTMFLNSSGTLFTDGSGPKAPASISAQWRNAKSQPVAITASSSHTLQFGVQYSAITNGGNNTWLRYLNCKVIY